MKGAWWCHKCGESNGESPGRCNDCGHERCSECRSSDPDDEEDEDEEDDDIF